MASNTLGTLFSVSSYGESHGKEVGVLIDGCPAGMLLDEVFISKMLRRRRPGQSDLTTSRNELDEFEISSGVFQGITTGHPILIRIPNTDQRSSDYEKVKNTYRPSHADQTYDLKYGIRDHRGGGRSSARITAGWVAAGAIALLYLKTLRDPGIYAYVRQVYEHLDTTPLHNIEWTNIESHPTRSSNPMSDELFQKTIALAKAQGDSLGGQIRGVILNPEIGLGEPVFSKFQAELGKALLSLNAVKGISFGEGFNFTTLKGSEANDEWGDGSEKPVSNYSGGLQGGITNGNPIYFDIAFKPTASINRPQNMLNKDGQIEEITLGGRHDPCVLPRAVPIVEALTAIVYLDFVLRKRGNR